MKSIQNQYRDLKEGKMSEANFMRNLRMSMPQYITNTTSFGDAVKILKNKSILTEALSNEEEVFSQGAQDENHNKVGTDGYDNVSEEEGDTSDEEIDAILKQLEDEKAGEIAVKSDVLDKPLEETEELNEAKKAEEKYSVHQCNPTELRLGIRTELENNGDMELDKAKEIAYKNIAKDPIYYTKLKLSGAESHPKKMKEEKPAKKAKKETIQLVDLVNGMKKVKMPKADEKKKLKEQVEEEAMRFQDLPADPEVYKTVKDMKGKIMKATNAEGVEFQRGDVVKTYDGEEIKIAEFKEEQGKIKALYNTGMFFKSIDIDGLEAPKQTMRPGVNIGASFEKFKRSLEEVVREVVKETFDGRDNLIDPIAAEEEK